MKILIAQSIVCVYVDPPEVAVAVGLLAVAVEPPQEVEQGIFYFRVLLLTPGAEDLTGNKNTLKVTKIKIPCKYGTILA